MNKKIKLSFKSNKNTNKNLINSLRMLKKSD